MKNLKIVFISFFLLSTSCVKHKYYFTPLIIGNTYQSESKKPIDSVKISIQLIDKTNSNLLSKKNTFSNKKGSFSINSDYIFYNGDGRKEESLFDGKYIKLLLLEKEGYVSDTIQIKNYWKSNDTIANIGSIYLDLIKK